MTAASRSLATALWGARFASGLLPPRYTTTRDTTHLGGLRGIAEIENNHLAGAIPSLF